MAKRYMNIDPDKDYITTDLERFEQRVLRGVQRPLLSTPYDPERGTRNHEAVDSSPDVAMPKIFKDTRAYLRKYFPEIRSDIIKIKELSPNLVIDFNLEVLEDNADG